MAEHFDVISQRLTSELSAAHDVHDVWEVGARSRRHQVTFNFRVPLDQHTPEGVAMIGNPIADALDSVSEHQYVFGVSYVQTLGHRGTMEDEYDVFYRTPDGLHQGRLRFPARGMTPEIVAAQIESAVAHLDHVSNA